MNSSRCPRIRFQQSAKPLSAADFVELGNRRPGWFSLFLSAVRLRRDQRLVLQALMRPFHVIVLQKLLAQVIEMPEPEHDKVIETFLLDRLDEPLGVDVHVRRAKGDFHRFDSFGVDRLVKGLAEGGIPITTNFGDLQALGSALCISVSRR